MTLWESQLGATRLGYSHAGSNCLGLLGTGHAQTCSLPHGLHQPLPSFAAGER